MMDIVLIGKELIQVDKSNREKELPTRLRFKKLGVSTAKSLIFKGLLSTSPLVSDCYNKEDNPLEFYLIISTKTGRTKVSSELEICQAQQ